ncbi:MAG: hypothetical protein IJO73_00460 [Clostridia bacterium]|nr:hypothetical protein [Clostridia bacterium]
MSLGYALKCLFCLIKCSKYLYFIKKAVCFTFVAIALITGITLLCSNGCTIKKLKEMI